MKKIAIGLVVVFVFSACGLIPASAPNTDPNTGPAVDIAGTVDAIAKNSVAQTLTALPTITIAPVTDTSIPPTVGSSTAAPTDTFTPTTVPPPAPNLTTTLDTATSAPLSSTFTATATIASAPGAATATLTPTLGILTYGTLPPAVPFNSITLINKSKTQAYISLQVTTIQGGPAILEYPVEGRVKIQAPVGFYLYVAWVGGNKMVGNFKLSGNRELTITLFKDKVVVQ